MFSVIATVECPRRACTILAGMPAYRERGPRVAEVVKPDVGGPRRPDLCLEGTAQSFGVVRRPVGAGDDKVVDVGVAGGSLSTSVVSPDGRVCS
jgi:hypothetical protein